MNINNKVTGGLASITTFNNTTGAITGISVTGNVVANNIGNVAAINLNGLSGMMLNGDGHWSYPQSRFAVRNIDKFCQVGFGNGLLLANNDVFCIKAGSNQYGAWASALGPTNGTNVDILRGINNCYQIFFPNEDSGTCIDTGTFGNSAYAVFTSGNLYTWGANSTGQLGLGDTTHRYQPVLSLTNVTEVYTHPSQNSSNDPWYSRLLAKKSDGTVWGCGQNTNYELGLGTNTNATSWVQLSWINNNPLSVWNLGNWRGGIIVQQADGTIWVSGSNGNGCLGLGNTTALTFATAAPSWLGGDNTMRIQNVVAGMRYSDAGGNQDLFNIAMFLDNGTSSRLVAAGANVWGNLGTGNTTNSSTPVAPLATTGLSGRIRQIMGTGGAPICMYVLMETNDLYSYGYNSYGQVGNNTTTAVSTPYKVMTNVNSMYGDVQGLFYAGYVTQSPVVWKNDGTFWTWGYGGNGQIGDGDNNNALTPQRIPLPKDLVPKTVGTICTSNEGIARFLVTTDNQIFAWGYNSGFIIDSVSNTTFYVPVQFKPEGLNG